MYLQITSAAAAFIIAILCGLIFIPLLRRLKFGQEIREEGPAWHASKSGTPTMGGFIFIAAIVAAVLVCYIVSEITGSGDLDMMNISMMIVISLCYGAIGFIDDFIKVILKRNLGLTAGQKFGLQFIVALGFVLWAVLGGRIDTQIGIPFTSLYFDLGIWGFMPLAIVVILATVNSVNLTDGLDGLASTITAVIAVFYMLFASFKIVNPAVALFASAIVGSLVGFLFYNAYPAKVFMGDTGSLFLGGAVCSMAILLKQPIALLIVGFVYVMETLSVILQVFWFKKTGKRLFKMSPLHHHFEMCGWSERKIVAVFTLVTVVLCALVYFMA